MGDFNEVLSVNEKVGGRARTDRQIQEFQDLLDDCGLLDLGYIGNPFTWCNKREPQHSISERLDRGLANLTWKNLYPMANVNHGSVAYSDHVPIKLQLQNDRAQRRGQKLFRFEAMWVEDKGCKPLIEKAWVNINGDRTMEGVLKQIQQCGEHLAKWNKDSFTNVQKKLRQAKGNWLERQEIIWRQRSRALWLTEASQRKVKNMIKGIKDDMGIWRKLFTSSTQRGTDMKQQLEMEFVAAEVKVALKEMNPTKAPGPDGMAPLFYQKYWAIVGGDVARAVLDVLNTGSFPSLLNYTYVTLIPKKKKAELVLANRLKTILPQLISGSQYNVLIAYELVHFLRRKRQGRKDFLETVMETMGFGAKWTSLLMLCVKSVSFSILVNGEPKGPIYPSRGLRQGDPISPYLFILCTEGLISLLQQADVKDINHLIFADDSVLFCRATAQTNRNILHLLEVYEKASGQMVNKDKTSMVFSKNFWGVQQQQNYDKRKHQAFSELQNKVWTKLQGWKEKLLSQGGKEVLIKVVALLIPTYTMSYFKLPASLCSKLESLIARFWWGQRNEENKISWVSWRKMCKSKLHGGMCFKDLRTFNLALLAKQSWRILKEESLLLHQLYKARYFHSTSFKEAKLGANPSFVWRGIWEAKHYLLKGCKWRVGDGKAINIWSDFWLPNHKLVPVLDSITQSQLNWKVSDLIDDRTRSWDVEKVRRCLPSREAEEVLHMVLTSVSRPDELIWEHEKSGQFSVRSAYRLFLADAASNQEGEVSFREDQTTMWRKIWKMQVPTRGLPSLKNLLFKKVVTDAMCPWCRLEEEDTNHALLNCVTFKDALLDQLSFLQNASGLLDFVQIMLQLALSKKVREMEQMALCTWGLWHRRNKLLFEQQRLSPQQVMDQAFSLQQEQKSAIEEQRKGLKPVYTWTPPQVGALKLNTDGATFQDQCSSGVGMVLRDENGQVIFTASKPEHKVTDPMEIEFLAVLRGLQICLPLGIAELEVELDSLSVIRRLLQRFPKVSIKHRGRMANAVAHCLARHSWHIDDLVIWWHSFPEFASQVIRHDALM
ncbi:hypothetical protein I3760_15G097700 [Carya illinoinensis]|nr:hypothetical protein I3760_15G097700 [Carya illinoinensis]